MKPTVVLGALGLAASQGVMRAGQAPPRLRHDRPAERWTEALPSAWPTGSVRGLRARGGFEVDLIWADAKFTGARVRSTLGGPCRVRSGPAAVEFATKAGEVVTLDAQLQCRR